MTTNVLMVLTSHADLGNTGEKTGFWVEEFAAPYYVLTDAGIQVTLASPAGGQPPIDPKSEMADFQTASTKRYDEDSVVQQLMANTQKLSEINPADFDAVFYPGGHGPLWDLATDQNSINLIESLIKANKPVAAVCHASAVLINAKSENGEPLVQGKAVTGFTNTEEAAVQLTDIVPFLVENELIKKGGDYQKAADWNAFAVQDGLLITGQNPQSSELAAQKLLQHLS